MQAVCRALVAEGRRFVETPEGRPARPAGGLDLIRHGRTLWEASARSADDRGETRPPTAFVDALVGVLTSAEFVNRLRGTPG
jgi:hypothetical protein